MQALTCSRRTRKQLRRGRVRLAARNNLLRLHSLLILKHKSCKSLPERLRIAYAPSLLLPKTLFPILADINCVFFAASVDALFLIPSFYTSSINSIYNDRI